MSKKYIVHVEEVDDNGGAIAAVILAAICYALYWVVTTIWTALTYIAQIPIRVLSALNDWSDELATSFNHLIRGQAFWSSSLSVLLILLVAFICTYYCSRGAYMKLKELAIVYVTFAGACIMILFTIKHFV